MDTTMRLYESGQALPLGIALLLAGTLTSIVLFNTGQVVNEKTRLEEREYWDNKEDDILDAWRIAKGIPLEKDEDDKLATATLDENTAPPALVRTATPATNVDDDEAKDSKDEKDNKPDISEALLYESGRIFSDLLHLMGVTGNADTKMAQSQNEQS